MPGPLTPKEAKERAADLYPVPEAVFEAFNELIVRDRGKVLQREVVALIKQKLPEGEHENIYRRHWLDVEDFYREKGWIVTYRKPDYNESNQFDPYFVFQEKP